MAKKPVKSDFEDIKIEEEFDFDESEFDDIDEANVKKGKRKGRGHIVFFAFVIVVLIACLISLMKWNKGEIIPQAIDNARTNAANNGIENATFFVGKAEEVLPKFYKENSKDDMSNPDVIVVDPPRKGCDEICLDTMLLMKPERIVYVSCDSATLARDLKILADGGYEMKKVRAFGLWVEFRTKPQKTTLKASLKTST